MTREAAVTHSASGAWSNPDAHPRSDTMLDQEATSGILVADRDLEQAIREAAYACFEARGGEPGHELDDWLKAEVMVRQGSGSVEPRPIEFTKRAGSGPIPVSRPNGKLDVRRRGVRKS